MRSTGPTGPVSAAILATGIGAFTVGLLTTSRVWQSRSCRRLADGFSRRAGSVNP